MVFNVSSSIRSAVCFYSKETGPGQLLGQPFIVNVRKPNVGTVDKFCSDVKSSILCQSRRALQRSMGYLMLAANVTRPKVKCH